MGQAFDRDGKVLGEAEGDSFREVAEKLERMHPTAHELRIRAMQEDNAKPDAGPRRGVHEGLRSRLLMASKSVFLATDKAVADDLAQLLVEAEKALAEVDQPIVLAGVTPPVIPVRMDEPGPFDALEHKLDEQQAQREAAGRAGHSTGD